jgi:putative nucleotidyltransferase with HDIG domain
VKGTVESALRREVEALWPELAWISDADLREKVARTWERAFEQSSLVPADLHHIPFTLLVPTCPVSFMAHKRCVVHVAQRAALAAREFLGDAFPVDMDVLIAGAILIDVGKLLEYEKVGEEVRKSRRGKYLRHPFSGVALAAACGVPDAVSHVIAAHSEEGNLGQRSVEAILVHHADFMTYLPFRDRLE